LAFEQVELIITVIMPLINHGAYLKQLIHLKAQVRLLDAGIVLQPNGSNLAANVSEENRTQV
jgi:hypothetical protein